MLFIATGARFSDIATHISGAPVGSTHRYGEAPGGPGAGIYTRLSSIPSGYFALILLRAANI